MPYPHNFDFNDFLYKDDDIKKILFENEIKKIKKCIKHLHLTNKCNNILLNLLLNDNSNNNNISNAIKKEINKKIFCKNKNVFDEININHLKFIFQINQSDINKIIFPSNNFN